LRLSLRHSHFVANVGNGEEVTVSVSAYAELAESA